MSARKSGAETKISDMGSSSNLRGGGHSWCVGQCRKNVALGVGFSDATGAAFELRVALPGVGEALKREIAGLVWVDR
jgi:hypothetical protein